MASFQLAASRQSIESFVAVCLVSTDYQPPCYQPDQAEWHTTISIEEIWKCLWVAHKLCVMYATPSCRDCTLF